MSEDPSLVLLGTHHTTVSSRSDAELVLERFERERADLCATERRQVSSVGCSGELVTRDLTPSWYARRTARHAPESLRFALDVSERDDGLFAVVVSIYAPALTPESPCPPSDDSPAAPASSAATTSNPAGSTSPG